MKKTEMTIDQERSTGLITENSRWEPRLLARAAGAFYVILIVAGGFAHVYVRGAVYIPDDPIATALLVAEKAYCVRIGVLIDLIGAIAFLLVGLTLYELLRHVDRFAARIMVALVVVAVAMTCLNMVFQYGGILLVTKDTYVNELDTNVLNSLTLFMFDLQHYGYILVQAFTGPWLLPLGYLVIRSSLIPKTIGGLLIIGGLAYLADLIVQILAPNVAEWASEYILAPAIIAEVVFVLHLLIRGVRVADQAAEI